MAGYEYGQDIGTVGIGHGSDGLGNACLLRQFFVRERSAVRDFQQRFPNMLLEIRPCEQHGDGKALPRFLEVVVQFPGRVVQEHVRRFDEIKVICVGEPLFSNFPTCFRRPITKAEFPFKFSEEQSAAGRGVFPDGNVLHASTIIWSLYSYRLLQAWRATLFHALRCAVQAKVHNSRLFPSCFTAHFLSFVPGCRAYRDFSASRHLHRVWAVLRGRLRLCRWRIFTCMPFA